MSKKRNFIKSLQELSEQAVEINQEISDTIDEFYGGGWSDEVDELITKWEVSNEKTQEKLNSVIAAIEEE